MNGPRAGLEGSASEPLLSPGDPDHERVESTPAFTSPPRVTVRHTRSMSDISLPLTPGRPPASRDVGADTKRTWRPKVAKAGLGTVYGVFVPCMLSIIGAILFVRLGWAVGEVGVLGVMLMFFIGGLMAVLTVLSVSAMASNGRIAAGGTYYLVSRSVGPELGGAIGLIFFAANVTGIAFYLQAFSDTVAQAYDWAYGLDHDTAAKALAIGGWLYFRKLLLAVVVLAVEAFISVVGSGLYSKVAFFIFLVQMASIIYANAALLFATPFTWSEVSAVTNPKWQGHRYNGTLTGPSWDTLHENLWNEPESCYSYLVIFGIIFPAMTGIMAGTNMSGVLRRAELAIPRGELMAIFSALFTYAVLIVSLGACVPRDTLLKDYYILSTVTTGDWWPGPVGVTVGIIASTTSSALASIQSGSRLLQALGKDGLLPALKVFEWTWRDEPVLGTLACCIIAVGLLVIGNLDSIAPVLTMFFLLTYATTNFATFVHTVAGHPNFRPRFVFFSWHTALAGGLLCIGLMFYLQWMATVVSLIIFVLTAGYIARRAPDTDWGRIGQSLIFHQVRKYLLQLDPAGDHVKFWRCQILYLTSSPCGRCNVLEFLNNLKKGGLFIMGDVVFTGTPNTEGLGPGGLPLGDSDVFGKVHRRRTQWQSFIDGAKMKAFIEIVMAPSLRLGVANLMLAGGLGGMRPNTVCMNFFRDSPGPDRRRADELNSVWDAKQGRYRVVAACQEWENSPPQHLSSPRETPCLEYVQVMRDIVTNGRNLVMLRHFDKLNKDRILADAVLKKTALGPHRRNARVHIDVWDLPWLASTQSFELAIQLAYMLVRVDFWYQHASLRVLSFVESDDERLENTKRKYAQLYQRINRDLRIPAAIEVVVLAEEVDPAFASAFDEAQCTSGFIPGRSSVLDTVRLSTRVALVNQLVLMHSASTAISFMPTLPSPTGVIEDRHAEQHVAALRRLTDGLGPLVLVQATEKVVSEDL